MNFLLIINYLFLFVSYLSAPIHVEDIVIDNYKDYLNYFPYVKDKKLIYNTTFGESVSTITQKNNEYILFSDSDKFKYTQTILVKNDGMYIKDVKQNLSLLLVVRKNTSTTYSTPILRLPSPLTSEWSFKGMQYENKDTSQILITGKFLGQESITTPAGTFNTIKIQTEYKTEGNNNIITEWIAPRTGIVKMSIQIKGGGILGLARDLLGYSKIEFNLKKII